MAPNPHDIVPAHLAVQAMRDNGYKNAAYAIAELMDNSIQAGATQVELLCAEKKELVNSRQRSRIHQVAVLDNGCGMDASVLRMALQFGNGTHLNEEDDRRGIGRFGMGLPSSSISQCQRVEVWSWQEDLENALYSYLDLNEIRQKQMTEVPEPQPKPVPTLWQRVGNSFENSGTLVVWSNIDRCIWKTSSSIIDNSELLIGRMYRKFLDNNEVEIRMLAFDVDALIPIGNERKALPNDPSYLMARTSCPAPFDKTPMFQPWEGQDKYEATVTIDFRGKPHEVKVRYSVAKEEARLIGKPGVNPGDLPYGKHAAKNIGISLMRAGRELELDQELVIKYDPTERWWGVEIDFPPSLDDLFGVTNNKQTARNFTEIAKLDIETLLQNGKTINQLKEELKEDEDPKGPLLDLVYKVDNQLKIIRRWVKAQTKDTRSSQKRYQDHIPEKVATAITTERKQEGHQGGSDKDELLPREQRQEFIEKTLVEQGVAETTAKELAATTVDDGLKYTFAEADLETAAFFSVKPRGGAIIVTLNTSHPAYKNLVEVLEEEVEGVDVETLRDRLTNSLEGLKLLLMAWARYEDEQPDGKRKQAAQDARVDWGRIARRFLEREE
ncbi:ATP-binding protein [Desertifilum sp. FACHB-1129]|uniref:Histidine kinase n=1 Tax=Desertifilum tharense IPPAS B-1220 TaxID=1781255 RepID=A0A1E5QQU2_9CYAN|nr:MULTISPECIES: ATP-binding protein [Desertifilum]MDA0210812.1 ATP-binding protein [Cyanobacteria bacterium FC1]MBD2312298.1 ATP-binding protein [Desertifilum sp. FACHB-1129]MBD2323635.1 ATP-binding protein [Desertifilum sp. FACHB-866]MBD2332332.1 ATP-binding protein [Desertifilum sp. FACHB-868]OEJ77028.1 histidine kinase [Desertifilum tharense IPPAS B-1220]